jgi:hypothetical protein
MTHMIRLTGLLTLALAGFALLAASARAAVWTAPMAPCYVSVNPGPRDRQVVPVAAQGFTPLAPVDVLLDGQPADATDDGQADPFYADPSGAVTARLRAPYQPVGERTFSLSVTERANPANSVSVTGRVTDLDAELRPAVAPPSQRVRYIGRGFTKAAPVWGHYLYRGAVRRTVRLVKRPTGPCGTFSVRRRQIPLERPRRGRWILQLDQQKAYAETPDSVWQRIKITVGRKIRRPAAAT